MNIGEIVSGYGTQEGVYLHTISKVDGDEVTIEITFYEPSHEDFEWAVGQVDAFGGLE